MSRLRCFIAVPPPPAVIERTAALIRGLQSIPSDVKWEDAEKLHITLKFLGSVEQNKVEVLVDSLEKRCRALPSFEYSYEGIGAFPDFDHPRVFWIGTARNTPFIDLHVRVEEVVRTIAPVDDVKQFHPHLTFGRVKGNRGLHRLTATLKTLTFEPVEARCSEVHLIKSVLSPSGSRYSLLARIPFNL